MTLFLGGSKISFSLVYLDHGKLIFGLKKGSYFVATINIFQAIKLF